MTTSESQIVENVRQYDRVLGQQVKAIIEQRDDARHEVQDLKDQITRLQQRHSEPGQTKWFPLGS